MKMFKKMALPLIIAGSMFSIVQAGDANQSNLADLSTKAQDPLAKIISFPILYTLYNNLGPDKKTNQVTTIQPVIPFTINSDWSLITRTIVPILNNEYPIDGAGIGDTYFTAIAATNITKGFRIGAGPIFLIPTGSNDDVSRDTWAGGLAVGGVLTQGRWVLGALAQNIWNMGGKTSINEFQIQPIINYDFGEKGGWIFTSSPMITANWEKSSDKWVVPIGGGVSVMTRVGKVPMTFSPQVYYDVAGDNSEWQFRFMARAIFPR